MGLASNVVQAFSHGGVFMWVVFFTQIASIAIIIERVQALYMRRKINNKQLVTQFEMDIKKGNLDSVIQKAQSLGSDSSLGRALIAGAQAARDLGGREEIQAKMDEVLLAENSQIEKRTGFLSAAGNVATLMGLLGTIVGLIDSFAAVANSNPIEKATLLSQGISLAMHATAYGLIVAIPALVMFSVLQNRAIQLCEDLNQSSLQAFNWLSFNYEAISRKSVK